jgi:HSP20 family molecular chaperone IbpA
MYRMDVRHDKDTKDINVTFDLPGLQKEDVSIDVHNKVLTVSGENTASSECTEGGYVVCERRYGKFMRSLSLPQGLSFRYAIQYSIREVLMTRRVERRMRPSINVDSEWGFGDLFQIQCQGAEPKINDHDRLRPLRVAKFISGAPGWCCGHPTCSALVLPHLFA